MFLLDVCQALDDSEVNYAVVGGYAVALHGAVRGTVDIDLIVKWQKQQLIQLEEAMQNLGLVSRLPVDAETMYAFRDEYTNNRNLIAWNFYHPNDASKQIDVIINYELKRQPLIEKKINAQNIKILNRKDLILMKQAANRPQDIEDIKALKSIK